ncbi:metallophosphoesterase family protein [Pararhodobacter sp. SW119]|uniref:metallophosphoesterase family protein n=1 Tax=Pararhodobacter sp. SW119 TaxID=2780075 RepID=UPI001ADFDA11|nr:metallophosphoesterase family protein [Pararhodobacter sp. SW119]
MRTYAIGDIHGHLDLLRTVHDWIEADRARTGDTEAPVVHLGDLVDRGPDSPGVIDYLMRGQEDGRNWVVLKGNHDRMFSIFLDDPKAQDPGLRQQFSYLHPAIGGAETLEAYGVRSAANRPLAKVHADAMVAVPAAHRAFLAGLPTHLERGPVFYVHAGIRPGVPLHEQTETDLVWIRAPFLEHGGPHPWLVVHGHTAIEAPTHYGPRVNIDSRAAYGGPLTAVVVEGREVCVLGPDGRQPLRPDPSATA